MASEWTKPGVFVQINDELTAAPLNVLHEARERLVAKISKETDLVLRLATECALGTIDREIARKEMVLS